MDSSLTTVAVIIVAVLTGVLIEISKPRLVLVLKEFRLNENENEFLKISGRAAGIIGWVLTKCGINPVTSLVCNKKAFRFETASIRQGKKTLNIPLVAVTGIDSGIHKPFFLLVLAFLSIAGGTAGAIAMNETSFFLAGIMAGAVFLVLYALNKTLFFGIYCGGDKPIACIYMKRSIIEGQAVDELKTAVASTALMNAVWKIHYLLATARAVK
jgi:hypothetical protein